MMTSKQMIFIPLWAAAAGLAFGLAFHLTTPCFTSQRNGTFELSSAVETIRALNSNPLIYPRIMTAPMEVPLLGRDERGLGQGGTYYSPVAAYVDGHVLGWLAVIDLCIEGGVQDAIMRVKHDPPLTLVQNASIKSDYSDDGFQKGVADCGEVLLQLRARYSDDIILEFSRAASATMRPGK